jgi:hypothetical protein
MEPPLIITSEKKLAFVKIIYHQIPMVSTGARRPRKKAFVMLAPIDK